MGSFKPSPASLGNVIEFRQTRSSCMLICDGRACQVSSETDGGLTLLWRYPIHPTPLARDEGVCEVDGPVVVIGWKTPPAAQHA